MRTRIIPTALLALALGCQTDQPTATRSLGVVARNLVQIVRLSPEKPVRNQVLTIESVIINDGGRLVDFTSRICGLDTQGDLALTGSLLMCAAYSMSAHLAPGDSIQGFDARVVTSPPGRYMLRVRHLLDPERWVEVPVEVR